MPEKVFGMVTVVPRGYNLFAGCSVVELPFFFAELDCGDDFDEAEVAELAWPLVTEPI